MAKNLVDVDTFTANVIVPEDGDPRNALSVEVPFQHLANRTRNLLSRIVSSVLAETAQTVVRWIPGADGSAADVALNNAGWLPAVGIGYWTAAVSVGGARARRVYNLGGVVPNGATITQVRARVDPVAVQPSPEHRMSAQVHVGNSTGIVSSSSDVTTDNTANAQWITISDLAIVVDKTSESYVVAVQNSLDDALDVIWGVEVTFTSIKRFLD